MTYQIRHFINISMGATALFLALPCSMAQTPSSVGDANRAAPPSEIPANAPAGSTAAALPSPYRPMTQDERFRYYVKHMFSAESVFRSAAGAAILQGTDTPAEWGQGAEGYGRRFANSYAQHIMRSTLTYGAAAVLHEDNRYFLSGESRLWPRLKYAIASEFLARRDDGTRRISFSKIGGVVATAFISREWQPPSTGGAVNGASAMGTAFGVEIGFNVAREFFPKIFHTPGPVQ